MSRHILALVFAISSAFAQFAGPAPGTRTFFSENRKFQLVIDDLETVLQRGAVIKMSGSIARADMGNRVFQWRSDFRGIMGVPYFEGNVFISDDGDFFLLGSGPIPRWTLHRPGKEPVDLGNPAILSQTPSVGPVRLRSRGSRSETITEVDQVGGEKIVRIWYAESDQWFAFKILDGAKIEPTKDLLDRWNETTRRRVGAILDRKRQDDLRKKLGSVSEKLSNLATNVTAAIRPGEMRQVYYQFIATRRNPADRERLVALLKANNSAASRLATLTGRANSMLGLYFNSSYLEKINHERLVADGLLAMFDQKLRAPPPTGQVYPQPLYNLGKLTGRAILPVPSNSGILRIWVAPEKLAGKDWLSDEIELLDIDLAKALFGSVEDEIHFSFGTVLPGRYLVKAIWDKRRSYDDWQKAGAGDYESAWVGPFEVQAGGSISNVIALCDGKGSPPAPNYYAADEYRAAHWREFLGNNLMTRARIFRDREAPLSSDTWIIATNIAPKGRIKHPAYIGMAPGPPPPQKDFLKRPEQLVVITMREPGSLEPVTQTAQVRILDEHGCTYPAAGGENSPQSATYRFPSFPRTAPTFRVVAYGISGKDDVLYDYILTNHARVQPLIANERELPLELRLDNLTMRVEAVYPSNRWIPATFLEDNKPTDGWSISEVIFTDSHGNFIDPWSSCSGEKFTGVLGRIKRKPPETEMRMFDFSVSRLSPREEKRF